MKSFEDWQRKHQRQIEDFERETDERIRQNNSRLDIEFAVLDASAQMHLDELLAGKSDEYKSGFLAGRLFEHEVTQAIFNA
jgi:hypothetical protein